MYKRRAVSNSESNTYSAAAAGCVTVTYHEAVKMHWLEERGWIGRGGSCTAMSVVISSNARTTNNIVAPASSGHRLP